MKRKIDLYLDADDTILQSSVAAIEIINNRYGLAPKKTIEDLKDWEYRSICEKVDAEEVEEIYDSKEFFDIIEFDPEFLKFYEKNKKHFRIWIVTKGNEKNLERKAIKMSEVFGDNYEFVGIPFTKTHKYSKAGLDMRGGIQVDDRSDCLISTNANIKVLIKHGKEYPWNETPKNEENLYVANDWNEIGDILEFMYEQQDLMMGWKD